MALFARGLPRLAVLFLVLAAFCLTPPEFLARGPDLCLWRHLLHVAECPACGSTRALAAFFHGQLREALGYNRNIILTGPGLLILIVLDCAELARKLLGRWREAPQAA
jgi:Protein of unknown function (DUF2752)